MTVGVHGKQSKTGKVQIMGIDRSDYLMIGWKLNTELVDHKDFDWHLVYDRAPDEFIYDGMCGKYIAFGKMVLYSDAYEGFTFTELEPADLVISEEEATELKELFREITFGQKLLDWSISGFEPKAFLFSHFS